MTSIAVDGEDPSADPVGYDALEPVRRQRPLGAAAHVRDEDRAHREPERGRQAEGAYPTPNVASAPPIAPNSRRSCGPADLPTNGPISAPTPRAAINSPSPISPASNLPSARIGREHEHAPGDPQPNFTASSARTRWSFRA